MRSRVASPWGDALGASITLAHSACLSHTHQLVDILLILYLAAMWAKRHI